MTDEMKNAFEQMDFRMPTRRRLDRGELVEGTVVSIGKAEVFVDIGTKAEAILDLKELSDGDGNVSVKVGDSIQAYVVSTEPELVLSYALARDQINAQALEDAFDLGIPVEGKVTGVNKGGFEIDLQGKRAFCPISQIDIGFCEDPSVHLEQRYQFRVTEFSEQGRNIVVSRRALLAEEREQAAAETMAQLQEGVELEGEVVTLQPYGAFVDVGGVQGMIHISEIAHQRIEHPSEALKVGERVRVRVMRVEPDAKHPDRPRIALSIKALLGDPWDDAAARLDEGAIVDGKVVRVQPFGAFIEIAPGVDGLAHISELADRHIKHPNDVVTLGQRVKAKVLKVEQATRRISLSLRTDEEYTAGTIAAGTVVDCVVDRVKPFGVFVRIKGGGRARGLIHVSETDVGERGSLVQSFPEGKELKALVLSVDPDSGKIALSQNALAEHQERADYAAFMGDAREGRKDSGSASFGTLGDALQKALKKP